MHATFKYNLKLYPSPADERDHIIKSNVPLKAKGLADISSYCTSVKDQGILGSCTAFASVAALEFLHRRFGGNKLDDMFSEKFTYYATRVNVLNWIPEDSGAYVRDAIKSLVKYGTCSEKNCVYDGDCHSAPNQTAYSEALKYQAISYAKFEDGSSPADRAQLINALKNNLDAGMPIVGGFICYSNIWNAVNGVIPPRNGQIIGGHAILIVGYNDSKQQFKFKNSWGGGWGEHGYGYLSYDHYYQGDMFDLWSIHKSELEDIKSVGLEIINPALRKNSDRTDVDDILKEISSKLDIILDRKKCMQAMNDIMLKYKAKPKLAALINTFKSGLYGAAS